VSVGDDGSGSGVDDAANNANQCRLARTIGTEQAKYLAAFYVQIDVFERLETAGIGLVDAAHEDDWDGKTEDGSVKKVKLVKASDTPIRRHTKIKGAANPFDPAWEEYFENRFGLKMKDSPRGKNQLLILWYMQEGLCPNCHEKITKETGWKIHYIQRKTDGGNHLLTQRISEYMGVVMPLNCNTAHTCLSYIRTF
jgi:hypothetical protein